MSLQIIAEPEDKEEKSSESDNQSKYKVGDLVKFVKVRFPGNAKSFSFALGRHEFSYGQKVVAMSDRGMAVGYINSFPYEQKVHKDMIPVNSIKSIANDEDIQNDIDTYKEEKKAEITCKNLIDKYKLDMVLTHVEFTQFGKKVVFYFTAPARVDFRDLVKELVVELKSRIELRQISVRDRSAAVGGIGSCGRQLCCSSFLEKYGSVNIKMAKGQNLSLNSNKINGVCGQLKCCLKYEDQVYKHKSKALPKQNSIIKTIGGDIGKVTKLHILSEQFEIITEKGSIKRYTADQFDEKLENFKFPQRFDHISNDTARVIGLSDHENDLLSEDFDKEMKALKADSKEYADKVFFDLFGANSVEELIESND